MTWRGWGRVEWKDGEQNLVETKGQEYDKG